MQIERVVVDPSKEVYHPGEVITIAVYFESPFVGQCEIGLVSVKHPAGAPFRGTSFAKSTNYLYEGQVYIRDANAGTCELRGRFTPVKGEPKTISVGDRIFEVRPLVPTTS